MSRMWLFMMHPSAGGLLISWEDQFMLLVYSRAFVLFTLWYICFLLWVTMRHQVESIWVISVKDGVQKGRGHIGPVFCGRPDMLKWKNFVDERNELKFEFWCTRVRYGVPVDVAGIASPIRMVQLRSSTSDKTSILSKFSVAEKTFGGWGGKKQQKTTGESIRLMSQARMLLEGVTWRVCRTKGMDYFIVIATPTQHLHRHDPFLNACNQQQIARRHKV